MQFFEDQLLEFVCRLALPGVNASLSEQAPGIDFGLRQQQPKADVFRLQKVLNRCRVVRWTLILVTIDFEHSCLYHHMSGSAQIIAWVWRYRAIIVVFSL